MVGEFHLIVGSAHNISDFGNRATRLVLLYLWARSKGHNKRKARLMRSCGPVGRAFLFVAYIYEETI